MLHCHRRRHRRRRQLIGVFAAASISSSCSDAVAGASSPDIDPVILDLREAAASTAAAAASPLAGNPVADISVEMAIRILNSAGGCGDEEGRKSRGRSAHQFLHALASSEAFKASFRRRPVLIRSEHVVEASRFHENAAKGAGYGYGCGGSWASGLFALEDLLSGVHGTVIPGQRTGDSVRDGTKADRWEKNGPIAGAASGHYDDSPMQTMTRADVRAALQNGTVFFNHAMMGFPTLAALSTLMTDSFGLPANVNVYVTPPNLDVSVPPHTDGQDVLIVQTEGKKRWRVFDMPPPINPYATGKAPPDPFSRGKRGDVITQEELGQPMLDIIVSAGDILYVPAGFPHTTDTRGEEGESVFDETSVHLTVGLDTNVWGLSFAHLRSMLLKRSGLASIIGGSVTKFDEIAARDAARPIPIGFLGPKGKDGKAVGGNVKDILCQQGKLRRDGDGRRHGGGALQEGVALYVGNFISELKQSMIRLEPGRWIDGVGGQVTPVNSEQGREGLPLLERFIEVAEFVLCSHVPAILDAQSDAFANVKLHDPAYQRKVQYYSKIQRDITTRFTAFVEADPRSASDNGGNDERKKQQEEERETRDLRDDIIFVLLMLAAIVVGLPAALDIVKDLLIDGRKGDPNSSNSISHREHDKVPKKKKRA